MGTRATIRFKCDDEEYYVYRGHDGYPENVDRDIKEVLEKIKGRWSEPDLSCLTTFFIGYYFDAKMRLPDYELTLSFHGDESYRYYVTWNRELKKWDYYFE